VAGVTKEGDVSFGPTIEWVVVEERPFVHVGTCAENMLNLAAKRRYLRGRFSCPPRFQQLSASFSDSEANDLDLLAAGLSDVALRCHQAGADEAGEYFAIEVVEENEQVLRETVRTVSEHLQRVVLFNGQVHYVLVPFATAPPVGVPGEAPRGSSGRISPAVR
jgi:hypothetical protein